MHKCTLVQGKFTLIELPRCTVISSLHFFARSAGSEKTRPSVFVSLRRDKSLRWGSDLSSQRSPLFLKRGEGGRCEVYRKTVSEDVKSFAVKQNVKLLNCVEAVVLIDDINNF